MVKGSFWAPLLLCLLQPTPGRSKLARPQNVTMLSQNFRVYLTWRPGPNYPLNVTYVVKYQSFENERWRKVKHCMGIASQECDLTCLRNQGLHIKYKGRVRAVAHGTYSLWAESPTYLDYLFDVEPAPPNLTWIRTQKTVSINATYELPHCVGLLNLKYEVEFWKEGSPNKTRSQATLHGTEVKIPISPASTGCYCLSARTIYLLITPKYSKFSQPVCFLLGTPGTQVIMLAPVLLLLAIIILSCMYCLKNIYSQQAKRPQSLDFSSYKCPVKTLELNRQESFRDLYIFPKTSLRQGRRAYTESSNPGITQPSKMEDCETEKSEDREYEDTDDSGTFEPYLGIPPLKGLVTGMEDAETNSQSLESTGSLIRQLGYGFSPVMDTLDSGNVFDSFWGESGTTSCLIKDGICGDGLSLPSPMFLKKSKGVEEPSEDNLSSRASPVPLNPSSPGLIVPEEPLASLRTLIITMDRSEEEGDWFMEGEEEEEEEEEMDNVSEVEGLWSEYSKRPKVTDYQHIHYRLH
ncbi:interferon lambda receptor 1 [Trichosurus vulpecula]|uniref:interferon lambda receptor 1 n=1 Tax=Trichosurus vulpecula TaxID=9337 RepID=UPI00186AFA73|nr:interferon lambda receptor 1 [Trichosurus vulpecula]